MRSKRPAADWERIESEFRAGVKPVRQIARESGLSHTAINKRAETNGWTRELGDRVRQSMRAKLVADVSSVVDAATEAQIVDAAAAQQVQVVREHRRDISRARRLSQRLLEDLEAAVGSREPLEALIAELADTKRRATMQRAVGLPSLVGTFEALVRAQRTVFALERQAFGIDERAASTEPTYEERLRRLHDMDPSARGAH